MAELNQNRRNRWPCAFLASTALILTIELLHAAGSPPTAAAGDDWRLGGEAASTRPPGRDDLLFLGDSTVKLGLVPRVIEARSGLRGYNLAMTAAQAPMIYFQFRRALAAGARPTAIVVDYTAPFLSRYTHIHERCSQYYSIGEAAELAWSIRDASFFGSVLLARLLPTLRDRDAWRLEIRESLFGRLKDHRLYYDEHRRNIKVNDGALIFPTHSVLADPVKEYSEKFPGPWSCRALHASYMSRLFRLADERGIRVYWLLTPMEQQMLTLCEKRGQAASFLKFASEFSANWTNVVVIDARHAADGQPMFTDGLHLNRRGAAALSEALGTYLANRNGQGRSGNGDRWMTLPRLSENPDMAPLEDLEQSMLALKRGEVIR
jgi:hypothetical protein